MSEGRIDVSATPSGEGIYVSLESFENLVRQPTPEEAAAMFADHRRTPGHGLLKADGGVIWNADLTIAEAQYLLDELQGAIDAWRDRQPEDDQVRAWREDTDGRYSAR